MNISHESASIDEKFSDMKCRPGVTSTRTASLMITQKEIAQVYFTGIQ